MYAVVGVSIATEVFEGTLQPDKPFVGVIVASIHHDQKEAKIQAKRLEDASKKGPLPFNYYAVSLRQVLTIGGEPKESVEDKIQEKQEVTSPKNDLSEMATLAECFSTLLHSLGIKEHSEDFLRQANDSIPKRKAEFLALVGEDVQKVDQLRNYYLDTLQDGSPTAMKVLQALNNVDEKGLPKCVN